MNRSTLSDITVKKNFLDQTNWSKRVIINEVIAIALILLFAYAAITKIQDYQAFTAQIATSPILAWISKPMAIFIPTVELITCLALIIPKLRLYGLYASFALMLSFTLYISALFTFSTKLPCSCGGIIDELGWKNHLIFNCFFVLISIIGIRLEKGLLKTKHEKLA
ncbi:hypothetical protein A4D02_32845 [Niastella koreensis]|uniref:Methylamine utilisation protein MauE domain-containing protein n=2 Tax=Niastella koreensis TaxID=354356 RepID=G8T8N5_NIAKG|nr:MauE/DoxX family redox-associated membrane protein [Niastella koreensis]AEW01215.1 hypothetical protein Niako_4975 [Niastella koreensis GR20-10]OQP45981.1 hypothetical protein A4D02_32845 [Niastella koreensis]